MENICIVLSGDIYAQRVDENCVNCIIQIFNPGDSFGEMNAIRRLSHECFTYGKG